MAGGSWEYMASFLGNGTSAAATTMLGKTNAKKEYMELYNGNGASSAMQANYEANSQNYGDAIYETSSAGTSYNSWNVEYSSFPYLTSPLFYRGGTHYGSYSGAFAFSCASGRSAASYCFRAVAL